LGGFLSFAHLFYVSAVFFSGFMWEKGRGMFVVWEGKHVSDVFGWAAVRV